jgi:transcriptional regulator with XRE-family HTH domain
MVVSEVVGERIRRRRQEKDLTLRDLAERIHMTAGYLSRVENQQITPSLDALQAIAAALNVPMFYFLDSEAGESVVRADARRQLSFPDSHLVYELLTPVGSTQLMSVLIRIEPGARRVTQPLAQANEQMMFVLAGQLRIQVGELTYLLDTKDSITFNGNQLQEFACEGEQETVILCTVVPPVL